MGKVCWKKIIQKDVKSKKKHDKVRGEVKAAVMKGDTISSDVLVYSLYETNPVYIISTASDNAKLTPTQNKVYSKIEKKTVDMKFHCLDFIHMYNLGWCQFMLQINFVYNIYLIIGCVIKSGSVPYLFGDLEEMQKMHTFMVFLMEFHWGKHLVFKYGVDDIFLLVPLH